MLRTPDPVGAMRLINNLNLAPTVFPVSAGEVWGAKDGYKKGEEILTKAHEFLCDCKVQMPFWCKGGGEEERLLIKVRHAREYIIRSTHETILNSILSLVAHFRTTTSGGCCGTRRT